MALVKTATFFIASLALIAWGYHELRYPKALPNDEAALNEPSTAAPQIPISSAEVAATAYTQPNRNNSFSVVKTATDVLQQVGLINPDPVDSSTAAEPRDFNGNWNLSGTDLTSDLVAPYFEKSEPEQIVYFTVDGVAVIRPNQGFTTPHPSGQTLYVGTAASVERTAEERQRSAEAADQARDATANPNNSQNPADAANRAKENSNEIPLAENAFRVVFFKPGKRDDGTTLVPINNNPANALQGPDFSFDQAESDDDEKRLLSSVLSLGHGGELMLKVAQAGYVKNEAGFDFAIYENAFRIGDLNLIFQEFAYVGVSDSPLQESFKWFDCKPQQQVLRGCVGAVPTAEGGDKFDLSDVGLDRISYIWIKDTGKNKNYPSKWPTEGADLDAVRLYHAYRSQ